MMCARCPRSRGPLTPRTLPPAARSCVDCPWRACPGTGRSVSADDGEGEGINRSISVGGGQ